MSESTFVLMSLLRDGKKLRWDGEFYQDTDAADVVAQVREHFGDTTYRTVIPRTVRLSEAPSYGEPIEAYDPMSRGAIAYRELAREFRRRHGRT